VFTLFGHHRPSTPRIPTDLRVTLRWQAGRRRFALHQVWERGHPYQDGRGGVVLAALAAAPVTDVFQGHTGDAVACRNCRCFEAEDQDVPAFVFPMLGDAHHLVGRIHPPQQPTCALCGGLMEPISLSAHQLLALQARR
jgi:hypothetical protein